MGVRSGKCRCRVQREGGARVTTNVLVGDLDLEVPNAARDGRRLEVVADGLPLFGGVQLTIDTTLVFPLHSNGIAWRDLNPGCYTSELNRLGECQMNLVIALLLPHGHSPPLCWRFGALAARMGRLAR